MPQTFNVGSRSVFVTLTAWVFIALSGLASVSALLQNATLASWLGFVRANSKTCSRTSETSSLPPFQRRPSANLRTALKTTTCW